MRTFLAIFMALLAGAAGAQDRLEANGRDRAAIYGLALAQVERGLSVNPDAPALRLLKARFLAELGRTREAADLLEALAATHPELVAQEQVLALQRATPAGQGLSLTQ